MTADALPPAGLHWFCVRTKRFNERPCAATLRGEMGLEVFCPMISFERARRTGRAWVTEALFPNYLFARFDYGMFHRRIRAVRGVLTIVGFGGVAHPVPGGVIEALRESVHGEETIVIPTEIEPGTGVKVVGGPFKGLEAIVTRVVPARQRVAILLEILGMEREVEVPASLVLPETGHPLAEKTGGPPTPSPPEPRGA
jgi:transcriptional antiterminator RfaH